MKLEPRFGSITIQTTKPVCLQIQGHRGFPSCPFPGGEAKVGCTVSESVYSHKPLSFLLFAVVCLQGPQSVPWKRSAFQGEWGQETLPQEEAHHWALCYAACFLSTCFGILLLLSLWPYFFFKPWPMLW